MTDLTMGQKTLPLSASRKFELASENARADKPKPRPYSLRLTEEERAELDRLSGSDSWSVYIRAQVFGEKSQKRRVLRKPAIDDRKLGMVLSALGESRLSQNLNQLARHANMGSLDVTEEVEQELIDACKAIVSMRDVLMQALGSRL